MRQTVRPRASDDAAARAAKLLSMEHAVTRCLAEAESESTALRAVIHAICDAEGWECGRYWRVDEQAGVLRFAESWCEPDPTILEFIANKRDAVYGPGVGLAGRAWQTGQATWVADIKKDARSLKAAVTLETGMRGAFHFPVTAGGKTLGVLAFNSREVREPDARLLQAVRVIGSQIGQFLQRKQAESILRASEEQFRAIFEQAAVGITRVDLNGVLVEVNQKFCEMLGYAREELLGKQVRDITHPGDYGEGVKLREQLKSGSAGSSSGEKRFLRKDGGTLWARRTMSKACDPEGRPLYVISIVEDITARKRGEQLQALEHAVTRCLAEAESESAALKAVIRAVCETQGWECGRYFNWNDKARLLRFNESWHAPSASLDEFIEKSSVLSYTPATGLIGEVFQAGKPMWVTDISKDSRLQKGIARAAGMHGTFLFPVMSAGRPIGVLSFHSTNVREPDERLLQAVRVIGSQIGQFLQRKQAEAVMRESEERFRGLSNLSSDVYWEQDEQYRFTSFSGTGTGLVNPANLQWIGKTRWEQNYINLSDSDWAAHIAVLDARKPFRDLELCRRNAAGESIWVSISGEPMFDSAGQFTGYRGVGKDITARKREDQLLVLEHAVTRCLAEADSAAGAVKGVLRAVCETEHWECGRYFEPDAEANVLRFHEAWCVPDPLVERFVEETRDLRFARGVGLVGRAWQSGTPLWATDIANDPRTLKSASALNAGMRGIFAVPVLAGGGALGVLAFSSSNPREPDERLLQGMRVIGSQVGQFLQRKQVEERTSNQALQQRLIAEFGQQALASTELADVLNRAAELAQATLKVEYSSVLRLAPDRRSLTYEAAVGWPQEWVGHRVVPLEPGSRLEHVLSQRELLTIEDYETESRYSTSPLRALGARSGVQVPILVAQGIFGVLSAHSRQLRRFSEDDLSFLRSVANILATAIERKDAEDRLARLAQFDTVTGLPNRHLFRDRLGQMLSQAQRNAWQVGVLFADLDRFKAINDTYGHGVGDELLRQVAARIKNAVRASDTVGRLSGDEFAVALANLAKAEDAGLVAQKIVGALAEPYTLDGHLAYVTASVGIALFPADGAGPDALIKNADTAMYRAKEQGRNSYQFYLPQMNERLMERLRRETLLRGALERREFRLHYQPKVNLATGVISGFEALLRWEHGGRLVSPAEFIPILEDTGLIVPVGEWVLRTACEQAREWQRLATGARPIAVNLSARQFQQKDLPAMVKRVLQETGVEPSLIELELTETLLMGDAEDAVEMLHQLKAVGVRLAVDDFGTGYSSLAYLKRFPLDTLKIDRAFVRDAISSPDDATITLTIINLAHSMKLKVVAEGVETEGQCSFLRAHLCDEMQGYYFARPLKVEDGTQALVLDRRLPNPDARPAVDSPTLLLVDENENDLTLLKQTLDAEGFSIVTAAGPAVGFELLARHGADIVITDHNLSGMSGVEFLSKVRKMYPDTVRVIMTGGDAPTLTRAINAAGIHRFLHKNWNSDRLCSEVHEAYRQRQEPDKIADR